MKLFCVGLAATSLLMADFRYEQTTRITKGMVLKMPFGKKPEPETTVHYMKGSRMATSSKTSTTVIDFDKQTLTMLNHDKKQYSVMTFDEMRQAMENMQAEMKKATRDTNASMEMKFDAKATGVEKEVGGVPAKQMIFTVEPQVTDGKQTAGMTKIVSDSWHSEAVPGYAEYKAFFERMKDKSNWMGMGNPMAAMGNQRGMAEAMRKMAEEMQKTPGIAVLTISRITMPGMNLDMSGMRTGPDGQVQQVDVGEAAKEAAGSAGGSAAGRAVGGSMGGMLGGALGGRLGGFGRKKKEEAPKVETPAPAPSAAPAAQGEGSLMMESFTESSNFSTAPIDEKVFAVPGDYSHVDSPFEKMRKR